MQEETKYDKQKKRKKVKKKKIEGFETRNKKK